MGWKRIFGRRIEAIRPKNHDGRHARLHRAFHAYSLPRGKLLIVLLLPLIFNLLLLAAIEVMVPFWFAVMKFCFTATDFPGDMVAIPFNLVIATVWLPSVDLYAGAPTQTQWWISAIGGVLVWLATKLMPPARLMPLIYVIRAMVLIHGTSLAFFALAPGAFPRDLSSYLFTSMAMGLLMMFLVPWVLAFVYYVFDFRLYQKVALTALVLLYFALALPIQYALHAALLWRLSLLFLPLFYLAFGYLLDVTVFIAFYAWAMTWDGPGLNHPPRSIAYPGDGDR